MDRLYAEQDRDQEGNRPVQHGPAAILWVGLIRRLIDAADRSGPPDFGELPDEPDRPAVIYYDPRTGAILPSNGRER